MLFFECIVFFAFFIALIGILESKISKKSKYEDSSWKKYHEETGESLYNIRNDKGKFGEYYVYNELDKNIKGYKRIVANVYLFNEDESRAEIDIIMIHETGFYVVESKNYSGYIVGNEKNSKWTQVVYHKNKKFTYPIYNPISQNTKHVKSLKRTLNIMNPTYLNSYVVFSGDCKINHIYLSDNCQTKVLKIKALAYSINEDIKKSHRVFTKNQVDLYYTKLKVFANKSDDIKEKHIARIKEKMH